MAAEPFHHVALDVDTAGDESKLAALGSAVRRVVSLQDIADHDAAVEDSDYGLDDDMMDAVMPIMPTDVAAQFATMYSQWAQAQDRPIKWNLIEPLPPESLLMHKDIPEVPSDSTLVAEMLSKVVVLKLNGGLGSRMGLNGPKSALEVRMGQSFLDLTVNQVEYLNTRYGADVPLILMNSFHTHNDTLNIIKKYKRHHINIRCFEQSVFPRLRSDTHEPMPTRPFCKEDKKYWYPPGHGDLFYSMAACGLLDELVSGEDPKEYMFVSNVDNLGAIVDLRILFHLFNSSCPFAMEITEKTRADVQGGAPYMYKGQPRLMEVSQVPHAHADTFHKKNKKKLFPYFNTNNLWLHLPTVKRLLEADKLKLDAIDTSAKRDGSYVQIENPVGSAIESFESSAFFVVPRTRFLPIKFTSDLLSVQSNLFQVKHGALIADDDRRLKERRLVPVVKLGPEFQTVDGYRLRIPHPPDMKELDHLTVSGDVRFGENVVLKGTVIIVANEGSRIDIPDGSVLEDKVITGNLRIFEH